MNKEIDEDLLIAKIQFFYDHLKCQLGDCQDMALIAQEADPKKTLVKIMQKYEKIAELYLDTFGGTLYDGKR